MADKSLNHLIAQTRQNISLLQELEQVSRQDAELILSKLPSVMDVSNAFRARAKYNYNEDGKEPQILSFTAGDVIEVLEVINVDWWHGRHRGREGHFPSSFVERLTNDAARHPVPPPPNPSYASMPPHVLSPFTPYPTQPYYAPPPAPYPPYNRPPPLPGPAPVVAHSNPPNNKKPGPHGSGLGNTLAHSAAGGAGFGAGSSLSSNFTNNLF